MVSEATFSSASYESLVVESSSSDDEVDSGISSGEEEVASPIQPQEPAAHDATKTTTAATTVAVQEKQCFFSFLLSKGCREAHRKKMEEKRAKDAEKRKKKEEAKAQQMRDAEEKAKHHHHHHNENKKEQCKSWVPTSPQQMQKAEDAMLAPIRAHIAFHDFVAGLNTFSTTAVNETKDAVSDADQLHVVLIHGFGGGAALWAQQWEALATFIPSADCKTKLAVHAVDLPGFARNPREKPVPPPPSSATAAEPSSTTAKESKEAKEKKKLDPKEFFMCDEEARSFLLNSLDRWFEAMRLFQKRVIIVGHSFGGYVAAHYLQMARRTALTTPKLAPAIEHLILCDPWGMSQKFRKLPGAVKKIIKLIRRTSPLGALRAVGPFGLKLFRRLRPDFANRWSGFLPDPNIFYEYTYHCNAQAPPIGERAFISCMDDEGQTLAPIDAFLPALFRDTMERRGQKKQKTTTAAEGDSQVVAVVPPPLHVTWIYGQQTWMNKSAGYDVAVDLEEFVMSRSDLSDNGDVQCVVQYMEIPNAAHQVNSDNASGFNKAILSAIGTAASGVVML